MNYDLPRIPVEDVIDGGVYEMEWRAGLGVGIALPIENGIRSYVGMRYKWGSVFPSTERDIASGLPYGTAMPTKLLGVIDIWNMPVRYSQEWGAEIDKHLREWNDRYPSDRWTDLEKDDAPI